VPSNRREGSYNNQVARNKRNEIVGTSGAGLTVIIYQKLVKDTWSDGGEMELRWYCWAEREALPAARWIVYIWLGAPRRLSPIHPLTQGTNLVSIPLSPPLPVTSPDALESPPLPTIASPALVYPAFWWKMTLRVQRH
jgi:hypothetical protein